MSSISRRPNGHRWISYSFASKRHTLRLGGVDDRTALEFQRRLDRLIEFQKLALPLEPETIAWLSKLDERLHRSLMTAGLAASRGPSSLGELLTTHLQHLTVRGSKPSTLVNAKVLHDNLRVFFSEGRSFRTITPAECDAFRFWLLTAAGKGGRPLARATATNRCHRAKSIFALAMDNGWIGENPFRHSAKRLEVNKARDVYVTPEMFTRIVNMTADKELRLLLAMVRFGGLRCPSEVRPMTWMRVRWDEGIIIVSAPKTEGHEGQERREIPIFDTLLPFLEDAWGASDERPFLMFPRHQISNTAITGRLESLCRKAGEALWAKPFVNMRASAERDQISAGRDIEQVAAWFGHSPTTALKHYGRYVKEQKTRSVSKALRTSTTQDAPEADSDAP